MRFCLFFLRAHEDSDCCAVASLSHGCASLTLQIELSKSYAANEWAEDLKRILQAAGTGNRPLVFLFTDAHIKWEGMVEDINNILNAGEVPNLFAQV